MRNVILILAVVALTGCVDAFGNYFEAKEAWFTIVKCAAFGMGVWWLMEIRRILTNIDDKLRNLTYLAGEIRNSQIKISQNTANFDL